MLLSPKLAHYRQVACETAVSAGNRAREMFAEPREIKNKGFRDIVTDADFATQLLITNAIQQAFPDHGFLTEEEDSQLPESGPIIWIIDPIDGTINYSRQLPEFCVSIAACIPTDDGFTPVAAAIYDPMRQELFAAAQGQGATVQFVSVNSKQFSVSSDLSPDDQLARPMQVSSVANAADGLLCIDWSSSPSKRATVLQLLTHLAPQSFTVRAIGTAALAMAWVAAGRVDSYLNLSLRPWDVAAALLLVQESGGSFTAPSGSPLVWDVAGMSCLVSNGRIQLDLPLL